MKKNILKLLFTLIIFSLFLTSLLSGCTKEEAVEPENTIPSTGNADNLDGTDNLQDVKFVLDWTPNTNHAGVYVAKVKGFFEKEGLNVSIIQPGESSADQLVASNTAQFGISYQEGVTFGCSGRYTYSFNCCCNQHNTSGFGS